MTDLIIGIRILTGYAVATHPASRQRAEWPLHPARVFMAMAAAHFESDRDADEADVLRWLETLPDPVVYASEFNERRTVTTYVPINDAPIGKNAGLLQSVASWPRSKQPRVFPRVRPHEETAFMVWPNVQLDGHREALERLCSKVTRIGHSSSLVQMWLAHDIPEGSDHQRWEQDDLETEMQMRVFRPGTLGYLEQQYGERAREDYHRLREQVATLRQEEKEIKGAGSHERKAEIKQRIEALSAKLPDEPPRDPIRPVISLWQGYRRERPKLDETIRGTVWEPHLIVRRLEPHDSQHIRLDLAANLQVTGAMHKAVIDHAGTPAPASISGHNGDGSPADQPHLAYLPLAFVGREHATGHLLGLAIAVPGDLDRKQRRQALAAIGQVEELRIGRLGKWKLAPDNMGKSNLRPEVWTGGNSGAAQWATVTPIAFDRHAKAKDRVEREKELEEVIKIGCGRIGLPEPTVILTPVSAHLGAPAAHEYPRLERKDGSQRRHAHAILVFEHPVRGPITLGAGRYRGYGFCRPLHV